MSGYSIEGVAEGSVTPPEETIEESIPNATGITAVRVA